MELVSGLRNPLSFFAVPPPESKSVFSISRFLPSHAVPVAGEGEWSWENTKVKAMQMLELMPDLCTVSSSINTFTTAAYAFLPTPLRVVFASVSALNLFLIPIMLRNVYELTTRLLSKLTHGFPLDHGLKLSYWTGLVAAFTALGAMGLKEFCSIVELDSPSLQKVMDAIFPWVGYVLRASMILQIMDVIAGERFGSRIDAAMKIGEHNNYWLPRISNPVHKLMHHTYGVHRQAVESLKIINEHRHYIRRANGLPKAVKTKIISLDASLHSWNPIRRMMAVSETNKLAVKLRDRSVSYVRNQIYGLGANVLAVFAMILTNAVAVAVLSAGSAGYYLTQTVTSWNMPSAATFGEKKSRSQDATFLQMLASIANRTVNRLF